MKTFLSCLVAFAIFSVGCGETGTTSKKGSDTSKPGAGSSTAKPADKESKK
jgi:hypothetical protein